MSEVTGNQLPKRIDVVAFSGMMFPTDSRQYLADLVRDVVKKHRPIAAVGAGGNIDGKALEKELSGLLKAERKALRALKPKLTSTQIDEALEDFQAKFEATYARAFSEYLHKVGVNYHFVIAEKVSDRPIGARILKLVSNMRDDVRLVGERADGTFDPEVKLPIQLEGAGVIRVIVPRRAPWYYRIITSFMQRLINSFVSRTFSEKPSLILVGGAGVGAYLPFYEGVPALAVPTLHKIDEQTSTENMVGCLAFRMESTKNGLRIIPRTYDFRPIVARERELSIPKSLTKAEQAVWKALTPSPANRGVILFRVNSGKEKHTEEQVDEAVKRLMERGLVEHREYSNHYIISENLRQKMHVSLASFLAGSKVVRHAASSCVHVGALKVLYFTRMLYFPRKVAHVDVIIDNGDLIQGLAHNYEYNGEVLPIAFGYDKQQIYAARITAKTLLLKIFEWRLPKYLKQGLPPEELIRKCLVTYVFNNGNHPAWVNWQKHALVLHFYERELKSVLTDGILRMLKSAEVSADYELVDRLVEKSVIRVGENQMIEIDGFSIGIKHPSKGRTLSKSHRIQDVVEYIWRSFDAFAESAVNKVGRFVVVYVANFHEAAAVHVVKFGKTVFGVMTGAYLKDTSFERDKDKFVDWGHALVTLCTTKDGLLAWNEVEYDNFIHPKDRELVFADEISTSQVLELCREINEITGDLPWRQ
jgi:hypothetical protein